MQKESKLGKTLAIAGLGLAGGAGLGGGGYLFGKKKGATQMADVMANEFTAANQEENRQLARMYFRKGLAYGSAMQKQSSMDKIAALEEVFEAAFNEEFNKLAEVPSKSGAAIGGVIGTSMGGTAGGFRSYGRAAQRVIEKNK